MEISIQSGRMCGTCVWLCCTVMSSQDVNSVHELSSVYLLIKSDSSVTVTPNPRMSMCARSTLYRHCPKKWHSFCYSFLIACLINHIILVFVQFSNLPQSANLFKSSSKNTETSESVFESYMIDQKIKDIQKKILGTDTKKTLIQNVRNNLQYHKSTCLLCPDSRLLTLSEQCNKDQLPSTTGISQKKKLTLLD